MWCRLPCTLKSSRNLKSSHQTLAQWTALTLACFWMAPKSQRSSRWVTISLISTDFNDVSLFIYLYSCAYMFTYHLQNMQNFNRLKIRGIMKIAFLFFYLVLSWADISWGKSDFMVLPLCFQKRQCYTSPNAMAKVRAKHANCSFFVWANDHRTLFRVPASEKRSGFIDLFTVYYAAATQIEYIYMCVFLTQTSVYLTV